MERAMLTITERKRLHEANSGLGHIGKQHHRSSLGGAHTGPPPPRAAGPHDGGASFTAWAVEGAEDHPLNCSENDHAETRSGVQFAAWCFVALILFVALPLYAWVVR
jgi:hypothetical protein